MKFCNIFTYLALVGPIVKTQGKTYPYLGCFLENSTSPSLGQDTKEYTGSPLTLDSCVTHCINGGWPYAGLQKGLCYCGLSYGQYGRSAAAGCSNTCDQDTIYCGGIGTKSVYYAVNMDFTAVAWRAYSLHDKAVKTYGSARRVCVAQDGDLASATSQAEFDNLINTYTTDKTKQNGVQNPHWAWMGLRYVKYLQSYEWVDETIAYNVTDVGNFWKPPPNTPGCVAIDFITKQWFTLPCDTKLHFVCHQNISGIPPPETAAQSKSVMFYIAIVFGAPLFFICYIGSCTSYIIYKIVKLWRKMKRQENNSGGDQEQTLMINEDFDNLEPSSESEPIIKDYIKYSFDSSGTCMELTNKTENWTFYTPPGTPIPIRGPPKLTPPTVMVTNNVVGRTSLLEQSRKLAHERRSRSEENGIASPANPRRHLIKPRQRKEKYPLDVDDRRSVSSSGSTQSVISTNQVHFNDTDNHDPKIKPHEAFSSKAFTASNKQNIPHTHGGDAIQMSISDIIHVKQIVKGRKSKKSKGILTS